jgi:hypothetical protein
LNFVEVGGFLSYKIIYTPKTVNLRAFDILTNDKTKIWTVLNYGEGQIRFSALRVWLLAADFCRKIEFVSSSFFTQHKAFESNEHFPSPD